MGQVATGDLGDLERFAAKKKNDLRIRLGMLWVLGTDWVKNQVDLEILDPML